MVKLWSSQVQVGHYLYGHELKSGNDTTDWDWGLGEDTLSLSYFYLASYSISFWHSIEPMHELDFILNIGSKYRTVQWQCVRNHPIKLYIGMKRAHLTDQDLFN